MKPSLSKLSIAVAAGSIALSGSTALHASHKSAKIIGGITAPANTYPWITSIQSKDGEHFCGGSLVAPEWVMTAAHCVEEESKGSMKVVVSEYDTSKAETGEQTRNVSQIVIHEEYGDDHDIALLKLDSPVNAGTIKTASAEQLANLANDANLKVMGWGNRDANGEDYPNTLHEVDVKRVSNEDCNKAYENLGTEITDNMMCAGVPEGGKDSCQGDSGGPLVIQQDSEWLQIGVVSFGEGCGLADYPGVYTNLAAYTNWIEQAKLTPPGQDNDDGADNGNDHDNDDDNHNDDLDFLDGEQAFGLPHYLVLESKTDQANPEHKITLTNTNDTDLQIANIRIEALEDYYFGDESFDDDSFSDDDFSEEPSTDIGNEEPEAQDSTNPSERNNDMPETSEMLFAITQDTCGNTSLASGASCEITLQFNGEKLDIQQLTQLDLRNFDEDDFGEDFNFDEFVDGDFDENEWLDQFSDELDSLEAGDFDDADMEDDQFGDNQYDEDAAEEDFSDYDAFEEQAVIVEEVLVIETNDADRPEIDVPLIGIMEIPEPKLTGPEYLDFHAKNDNQMIEEDFVLENDSDNPLSITSIEVQGSTAFTLASNACVSETVEAGQSCGLTIQYTPDAETESEAYIVVKYSDTTSGSDEEIQIPVYGLVYSRLDMDEEFDEEGQEGENIEGEGIDGEEVATMLDWYFNGQTPWGTSNADAFELITDLLSENDESLLMTEVEGPATLDFDFSLDGDNADNELSFIVDGKTVKTINGASSSSTHSTELSAGKHTVQWVYKKKSENSNAKASVSNVRVKPRSAEGTSNSANTSDASSGGGSTGLGILALLMGLLGLKRFRK